MRNHKSWWTIGLVVITAGAALLTGLLSQHPTTPTPGSPDARQRYSELYDAAWRQDSGQGNVTMSATLMVPSMITALNQDAGRSSAEDQLNQALQALTDKQVGIFLTIDSVTGAIPDDTIKTSSTVTADGPAFSVVDWQPMIAPSHIVNTNEPSSSQTGLLVLQADQAVIWSTLRNLKLIIRNIDHQAQRQFVWVDPSLLQAD